MKNQIYKGIEGKYLGAVNNLLDSHGQFDTLPHTIRENKIISQQELRTIIFRCFFAF